MSYSGKFKDKNNNLHPVTSVLYGTCDTAAATAAKVVTCTDFDALMTGVTIRVKFANANTAASPTVNINSTGAKSVYRFGSTAPVDGNSWNAGEVVELVYDGTSFFMTGADDLSVKQNVTDNSLQTTDKTVVGAINEHEGDVSTLKSGLTNLDNEVNGDATVYPYADVITIENAVPANLADCSVKIEPVHSGSGDPSPTNIRPITGHTEASVQRDGKNLVDITQAYIYDRYIAYGGSSGDIPDGSYTPNAGTYTVSFNKPFQIAAIRDETGTAISNESNTNSITFTTAKKQAIKISSVFASEADRATTIQIEIGQTATPYVPYAGKTYTIALGDTIYGGEVDFNTGVMTVTKGIADLGDLSWSYNEEGSFAGYFRTSSLGSIIKKPANNDTLVNAICEAYNTVTWNAITSSSNGDYAVDGATGMLILVNTDYTDATAFQTAMEGVHIVYELATPTTIQLTPQQIQLLKGTNTITASTGQISVTVNGVSGAIGSLTSDKQDKTDYALETTAKTVVGGINEVKSEFEGIDKGYYSRNVVSGKWYKIADISATTWTIHNTIIAFNGNMLKHIVLRYDNDSHTFNNNMTKINSLNGLVGYVGIKFGTNSAELYVKAGHTGVSTYTVLTDGVEGTLNYHKPIETAYTDSDMDLIESGS